MGHGTVLWRCIPWPMAWSYGHHDVERLEPGPHESMHNQGMCNGTWGMGMGMAVMAIDGMISGSWQPGCWAEEIAGEWRRVRKRRAWGRARRVRPPTACLESGTGRWT